LVQRRWGNEIWRRLTEIYLFLGVLYLFT
jgi:hypothetical protein